MKTENFSAPLEPNEQLLWTSKAVPSKLLDKNNKSNVIKWFLSIGIVFAAAMFFYIHACVKAGTDISVGTLVVFVMLAALIFIDPIKTHSKVNKIEYGITNQRVIVCTDADKFYSIPVKQAEPVKVLEDEDNASTIIFGPIKKINPSKLRFLALMGNRYGEDEEEKKYPVFYRIPDVKDALHALETARG